jgi:hypothetical protein
VTAQQLGTNLQEAEIEQRLGKEPIRARINLSFDVSHLISKALPIWVKRCVDPELWVMPLEAADDAFTRVWIRPPAQATRRVPSDDQDF